MTQASAQAYGINNFPTSKNDIKVSSQHKSHALRTI